MIENQPTKTSRHADWPKLEAHFADYLKGDSKVVTPLFSALQRAIHGYFLVRMSSKVDAEDLSQAALLKIHFSRDRYDPSLSLKTWVFTIASRTLIDHWRGNAVIEKYVEKPKERDGEVDLSELEAFASQNLGPDQKTELSHDINEALKTLKPLDRSIVYLFGVEGMSMAEIAELHSMSEGSAKLRAHRAYRELRKLLVMILVLLLRETYGRY